MDKRRTANEGGGAVADEFKVHERIEQDVAAGKIVAEVDAACMRCALSLYPNVSGKAFNEQDVLALLKRFKVTRGLEVDAVQSVIGEALETAAPVEARIVARGQPKQEGRDAYFEYPALERLMAERSDSLSAQNVSLDKFSSTNIINVKEGETVAIYHPLEEGTPGYTVRGLTLGVKPAVDKTPRPGPNLRWDQQDLVAAADGRLLIEERTIRVNDVLVFDEDLTVVMGDIDFVGKIVVGRNIESGLKIRCQKDVHVKGSVFGSDVECEGDLIVEKGIVGSEDRAIEVRGDLTARFVENATLRVWGNARIHDSFVTSTLLCGDTLAMTDGRGHFVSGHAAARCGIRVRSVGIPLGTKVRLAVGRDMLAKERMDFLTEEMERVKTQLKNIRDLDNKVGPMTRAYQKLPPRKQAEIELLLDQIPRLEEAQEQLQKEADALQKKLVPLYDVRILISGKVCADTVVEFPLHWMRVDSEVCEVVYRFNETTAKVEQAAA